VVFTIDGNLNRCGFGFLGVLSWCSVYLRHHSLYFFPFSVSFFQCSLHLLVENKILLLKKKRWQPRFLQYFTIVVDYCEMSEINWNVVIQLVIINIINSRRYYGFVVTKFAIKITYIVNENPIKKPS